MTKEDIEIKRLLKFEYSRSEPFKNKDISESKIMSPEKWFEKHYKIDHLDFIYDHATIKLMQQYAIYVRDYFVDKIYEDLDDFEDDGYLELNILQNHILSLKTHKDLEI